MWRDIMHAAFILVFFTITISVGIYSRRHTKDVGSFVLGGRSVGPWLTAFSYGATYFSAVVFIGYAGQISLGHAAFFGLGAYGSAIATTTFHCSPWLAMILVAVCVALLALLIGIPLLRLSGHYLAMATLGLNYVVHNILLQWDEVTGGPSGFAGIPALTLGNFSLDTPIRRHYLLWCFVIITMLFCLNLVRSSAGRSLAALAGDELAAASLGEIGRASCRERV